MKLFFAAEDSRVVALSSVSTIYVIEPIKYVFCFGVKAETFGGDINSDVRRELSIQVLNVVR